MFVFILCVTKINVTDRKKEYLRRIQQLLTCNIIPRSVP